VAVNTLRVRGAAANLLTNPALDPFGKIPEFKFCAARVERADVVSEAAE
jgi:formate dehydrogenase major subunit